MPTYRRRKGIAAAVLASSFLAGCGTSPATPQAGTEPTTESTASDANTATEAVLEATGEPVRATAPTPTNPPSGLTQYPYPEDVLAPRWLDGLRDKQLATVPSIDVMCDFRFTDRAAESGITFEHTSVDYAAKINVAAHYDHGNGIAVADVNNDGLLDIYFCTQIGKNQLWINSGGGTFTSSPNTAIGLDNKIGVSASFADTDNDGDADLFVTSIRGGNHFFENDGNGQFTDRTDASGLGYNGHSSSGVFFDYDKDGLLDLFLCNVGIYTEDAKDQSGIHPPLPDAFAGHLMPEQRNEPSILYRNMGNNRFSDVTAQTGLIDNSWTGEATPIDANEDGWPDLYVVNMQGNDEYYENVGGEKFVCKSRELFPRTSWGAMGVVVLDFDNDAKLDIYVTDMHSDMSAPTAVEDEQKKSEMMWPPKFLKTDGQSIFGNSFFHNQGNHTFAEISDAIGVENYWPWGVSSGDLNADGFEDLFVAASMNYPFRYCVNKVLLNGNGNTFHDAEFIVGVEPRKDGKTAKANFTLDPAGKDKAHQLVTRLNITEPVEVWGALGSRSSVLFDVDNDGDIDIVTNEFNDGPMVLISNLSQQKQINWLQIDLDGTKSNRSGMGTTVQVHTATGVLTKSNDGRSGYLSQSDRPLYFGLADETNVEKIVLKWPSGMSQTIDGPIRANQTLSITEE